MLCPLPLPVCSTAPFLNESNRSTSRRPEPGADLSARKGCVLDSFLQPELFEQRDKVRVSVHGVPALVCQKRVEQKGVPRRVRLLQPTEPLVVVLQTSVAYGLPIGVA